MIAPRNRVLRSPQSHKTTLGGTNGAGNPAPTQSSPTPPNCGQNPSPTCRAKSDTPQAWFRITAAVYNLLRITALDVAPA
jgi:hypothetical protein